MKWEHIEAFVQHLETLKNDSGADSDLYNAGQSRAALAVLRRALSGENRDLLRTYRYLGRLLPTRMDERDRCILVAALYGDHPLNTSIGNMGCHLFDLCISDPDRLRFVERRLTMMLAAHPDDLATHLARAVGLLKAAQIPVNWAQLLGDVLRWEKRQGAVQRNWAYAFWGPHLAHESTRTTENGANSAEQSPADFEADY